MPKHSNVVSKVVKNRLQKAFRDFVCKDVSPKVKHFPNPKEVYIDWLEMNFTSDMDWNNLGTVWEIDHVAPLWLFDLPKETFICYQFFNLLPLTKEENKRKGGSVEYALEYYSEMAELHSTMMVEDILKRCHKYHNPYVFSPDIREFLASRN